MTNMFFLFKVIQDKNTPPYMKDYFCIKFNFLGKLPTVFRQNPLNIEDYSYDIT